jgi:hypothetical protein
VTPGEIIVFNHVMLVFESNMIDEMGSTKFTILILLPCHVKYNKPCSDNGSLV